MVKSPQKSKNGKKPAHQSLKVKAKTQHPRRESKITGHAVFEKYPHLLQSDVSYLGRPVLEPILDRVYNAKDVKYVADLKQKQTTFMDARKAEYWKVREIEWDKYRTEREKARVVDRAERIRKQELVKSERLDKSEKLLKACKKAEKKRTTISRRKRHCSDSGLPFDIWCKIFECLCDSIELEGVRGPSVVARELIHISLVSKELYTASLSGFQRLSQSCRTIKDSAALARPFLTWRRAEIEGKKPPIVRENALWDKLVSDPLSLKMTELKDLSATLGLYANGSDPKSVVTLDLFEFLGLQTPTRVPAQ